MHTLTPGEAVPAPRLHEATAALGQLSAEHGHYAATQAGRLALCAMALAVIVRTAARLPDCPERKALARACAELRQVV